MPSNRLPDLNILEQRVIFCKNLDHVKLTWTIRHRWKWLWNHSTITGIPDGIFQREGLEPQKWLKLVDTQRDSILWGELECP